MESVLHANETKIPAYLFDEIDKCVAALEREILK